ncbi:MAG: 16S rRNA (guanine(966)-N(2))-methyltransferase RsmD [Nitrospirae bacterium]|nr:16S rRNA (guanine(966)-N(2))-methyltransferase RsmD [Nitrospirota bacterium]
MRITAGKAKGRSVKAKGKDIRPTAAKVREAIFNIIGPQIQGATFVDLYAGTGAVGLEALSRGASKCYFVEINPLRVELIKKLATQFGFKEGVHVYRMKAVNFIKRLADRGEKVQYIFVDPPYQSEEIMLVLPLIAKHPVLADTGMVIVEHFSKRRLPDSVEGLCKLKEYNYGDTNITTYVLEVKE